MLYVRSKLDLSLNASKLTGLVKRYWVGTVKDIVSSLKDKTETCFSFVKAQERNLSMAEEFFY